MDSEFAVVLLHWRRLKKERAGLDSGVDIRAGNYLIQAKQGQFELESSKEWPILITTNYDELLKEALPAAQEPKSSTLPGTRFIRFGAGFYSKTVLERVLIPAVADIQREWQDAMDEGRCLAANLTRLRGYVNLILVLLMQALMSVAKRRTSGD